MYPTTYRIEHPDDDAASQWEDEGGHVEEKPSTPEITIVDDQELLKEE